MALNRAAHGQALAEMTRAQIRDLDQLGVCTAGNAFSSVLFAKGEPGPAEKNNEPLLSGPDGKALRAALLHLGYAPEDWAAVDARIEPALLRRAVCVLDPATLVALDEVAAAKIRDAYADDLCALACLEDALLEPGRVVQVLGMRVLNLGGFEAALASDQQKQVVWAYLKQIPPLGEPY